LSHSSSKSKKGRNRKGNIRPERSERFSLDISLLKEYGFKKRTIGSPDLNLKKIDKFGMRQLDRLKMLLFRNESLVGNYSDELRMKIAANDLGSFAAALALLSPVLVAEWIIARQRKCIIRG
jgi:hypothetical protein